MNKLEQKSVVISVLKWWFILNRFIYDLVNTWLAKWYVSDICTASEPHWILADSYSYPTFSIVRIILIWFFIFNVFLNINEKYKFSIFNGIGNKRCSVASVPRHGSQPQCTEVLVRCHKDPSAISSLTN